MTIIALTILTATTAIEPPETQEAPPPAVESTESASEREGSEAGFGAVTDVAATATGSLRADGLGALRRLWRDAGIDSSLFAGQPDDHPLQLAVTQVELDGTDGNETLLVITDENASDYHFLAIQEDATTPTVIGWTDVRNQRSGQPACRVEHVGDGRWLVIRALKGSGSGFSRVHEVWHSAAASLKQVLSYPVEGFVNGHGMPFNRSFVGSSPRLEEIDGASVVSIDLSVCYTNGDQFAIDGLHELFTRTAEARYSLRDDSFVLDEAASGMNEAEIEGIFGDDAEGFLRHNFAQLKEIAQGDDSLKRRWLRLFLESREESSEKSVLEELLGAEAIITTPRE